MAMRKIRTDEENNIIGRKSKSHYVVTVKEKLKIEDIPIPALIAKNEKKLSLWNFICADLSSRDLLSTTYIHVIEMLVHNIILFNKLTESLEKEDTTYLTQTMSGETIVRSNPVFDHYCKIQNMINNGLQALGMSPRDIIYTTNPAATAQLKQIDSERKKLNYFK